MSQAVTTANSTSNLTALLVPLADRTLMLPNVALAELIPYRAPQVTPGLPAWFLGQVPWRDLQLPLLSFEAAERASAAGERDALLTFVIVGGGPTGVELAGMIPEVTHHALKGEFRRIDPRRARVLLLEGGPRILPAFPEELSARAQRDLEALGFDWLDIFQPSFLLGARAESRPAERAGQMIIEAVQFALAGPLERYRGIPAASVARAMATRAAEPGEPGVRRHEWASIAALASGA